MVGLVTGTPPPLPPPLPAATVADLPAPVRRRRLAERFPRATTAVLVAIALVEGWVGTNHVGLTGPWWDQLGRGWIALSVVAALTLVWRQRLPWVALAVAAAAAVFSEATGHQLVVFALLVLVHHLTVERSTATGATAAAGVSTLVLLAELVGPEAEPGRAITLTAVPLAFVVLLGANTGSRRRYLTAVLERSAQLERERHQQAALAAAAERARIAREMHDVVAHSLSVVVRLSDGASAVLVDDPVRAARAVEHIGTVSRQSLTDMRRLLGVLRTSDDTELAPAPGLSDLDALVATFRAAGLPVVLEQSTRGDVPQTVGLVVYRAVQEGLTNALRYAETPTEVRARVTERAGGLEVEVSDDGQASPRTPTAGSSSSGFGLAGLRERAALVGGTLEVGTGPGGTGWRLLLVVPRQPHGDR